MDRIRKIIKDLERVLKSNATDGEKFNAGVILERLKEKHEVKEANAEPRITVNKGISAGSVTVVRIDGKGGCTIMKPIDEYSATAFVEGSLRIRLTNKEKEMVWSEI